MVNHDIPASVYSLVTLTLSVVVLVSGCESLQTAGTSVERAVIPTISGVLVQDGEPAGGVKLRTSLNEGPRSTCEIALAETVSAGDGVFAFASITDEKMLATLDRLENDWQVCVEDGNGDWRLVWFERHAGMMFKGRESRLKCDLDRLEDASGTKAGWLARLQATGSVCTVEDRG